MPGYDEHNLPAIGARVVSGNSAGTVVDYGWTRYALCSDRVVIVDWDSGETPMPVQPRCLSAGDMANCGHTYQPDGFATGRAIDALGYTLCYACAADRDRAELHAGRPIVAYIGEQAHRDGPYRLITWAGEYLGYVGVTNRPANRRRYISGTADGVDVYGSGPIDSGTYVHVYPSKAVRHV